MYLVLRVCCCLNSNLDDFVFLFFFPLQIELLQSTSLEISLTRYLQMMFISLLVVCKQLRFWSQHSQILVPTFCCLGQATPCTIPEQLSASSRSVATTSFQKMAGRSILTQLRLLQMTKPLLYSLSTLAIHAETFSPVNTFKRLRKLLANLECLWSRTKSTRI